MPMYPPGNGLKSRAFLVACPNIGLHVIEQGRMWVLRVQVLLVNP